MALNSDSSVSEGKSCGDVGRYESPGREGQKKSAGISSQVNGKTTTFFLIQCFSSFLDSKVKKDLAIYVPSNGVDG